MGRKTLPIRDLVEQCIAKGMKTPEIITHLRDLGISSGCKSTIESIRHDLSLGRPAPKPDEILSPSPEITAPALPEMGKGRMSAALSHAVDRLLMILDDPREQAGVRIKAGEAAGQLAVVGAKLELEADDE